MEMRREVREIQGMIKALDEVYIQVRKYYVLNGLDGTKSPTGDKIIQAYADFSAALFDLKTEEDKYQKEKEDRLMRQIECRPLKKNASPVSLVHMGIYK